jgi:hypothetical protein
MGEQGEQNRAAKKTEYLLFLPARNVEALGTLLREHWQELPSAA